MLLVVISLPVGPRASMGDVRPPSQVSKRTATPDSKLVSRRRVSAAHQRSCPDEQFVKPSDPTTPQATIPVRSSTLRPRNVNATSVLPKYWPKSAIESAKPPSPVKAGTRCRLSFSAAFSAIRLQHSPLCLCSAIYIRQRKIRSK